MRPTYSLHTIANGDRGTKQTLNIMSSIVKSYKRAPAVRELALKLTAGIPNHHYSAEAAELHAWVQSNIRYVKDVRGVETIQTPIQTLRLKAGDCDDMSTMLAALLESIGHPTRFVAVGFKSRGFSHVLTQTKVGKIWVWLECTKPLAYGERPENMTKFMQVHN